jgi:hypothetical protein
MAEKPCGNDVMRSSSGGDVRRIAIVASLLAFATSLEAQVVRGVVSERVSGQRLAGVVVSVASVPDSLGPGTRHALTDERGEFAITLPRAGSYLLSAKRIGVARYSTSVFEVRVGETKRFDITLEQFGHRLPNVAVAATNLCLPKPDQLRTFVALWDEARTALIASELSVEDTRLSGWLSQYQRSLEPTTLRILQDQRSVAEGLYDRPVRSISGDSLAKVGYWRKQDTDTMVFYGPDAEALLSDAFQSGHCFEVVQGRGDRRGFMGLSFRPRRVQPMGGIDGTIWLDGSNFELRFVEFRYTNLITIPRSPHLGGEVHFLRHDSGAWVVRRWFIRMPLFPEIRPAIIPRGGAGFARSTPKPSIYRIIEQGGGLFLPLQRTWEKPGFIEGVIMDSTGRRPLREAMVSLSGTPYSTVVDAEGRFRFDSIPPGAYTLLASHRDYADLGQLADDEPLNVVAGVTYRSRMQAISTSAMLNILCDGKPVDPTRSTLRLTVMHSDNGTPVAELPVVLRWLESMKVDTAKISSPGGTLFDSITTTFNLPGLQLITDQNGAATFCGVPADKSLELMVPRSDDDPEFVPGQRAIRITSFILRPGQLVTRTVSVRPPK